MTLSNNSSKTSAQFFFAHIESKWKPDQLFLRSTWEPNAYELPPEFRARVTCFTRCLQAAFAQRRAKPNLTPYQGRLIRLLAASNDFIVFPSDKNLGPVILERAEHIQRTHTDHLSDSLTCKQLTMTEAFDCMSTIEDLLLSDFLDTHGGALDHHDRVCLERSAQVDDPFACFYLTAKGPQNSLCHSPHCLSRW
jgi:hypothetical protein